jgi:hypothetical protein
MHSEGACGPGTPVADGFRHDGNERNRIGHGVRNERQGTTVLVISGCTSSQIADEEEKFDFLQKPIAPHKLLEKVRELFFRPPVPQHSDDT